MAEYNIVILGLFKDKVIFNLQNKQYSLIPGESVGENITLVSADSNMAIFKIEGEQKRYTLGGHIGSTFDKFVHEKIVTIAPDQNGMYWANGNINKFQTRFLVDTGATVISMNRHSAARFGIDYKMIGKKAISNTAAGPDTVYLVKLASVKVGDIELNNVAAAVHDSDYPEVILLGNSFLKNVSIKRDGQLLQLSR
ncbi:MAG: aspartyl protease family protein [Gammaproteobacteria bacterium]|jgi:aspartyl protease family protein